MWLHLIEVCLSVCVVGPGFDSTFPGFCEEQSQPGGRERRPACQKNRIGPSSLGAGIMWTQFVQMSASVQPRAGCSTPSGAYNIHVPGIGPHVNECIIHNY